MMRMSDWKRYERIGWTVFIGLLFIAVYGYTFNGGDQEEHLPYVYKLLNHGLYQHDYIVPFQISNFTVRFYFAWLLYGFGCFLPMSITVLTFYFICLGTMIYFTGRIAEEGSGWKNAFIIGPLIVFILLNSFTVSANTIFDNQLTCSCFASALCSIAIFLCMKNRILLSASLAGIASLFQVLIGLQVAMLLMAIIVFSIDDHKIKNLFFTFLTYLIFSSAMLVPIVWRQSIGIPIADVNLYNDILFKFRNAHHYLPSYFPLKDYLKTLFCWILIVLFSLKYKTKWNTMVVSLMLFVTIGCLLYWIGFEKLKYTSIGKLQWFKTTGWITLLGIIPITKYLGDLIWLNRFTTNIISALRTTIWPISLLLFVVLSNTSFIPIEKFRMRYQIGNYPKSDLSKMHFWIANNTPLDCVILPLPDDDSFLCEAQRSIPVGYKAIIHEPFFLLPWYKNFYSIYGVGLLPENINQHVIERAKLLYPNRPDSTIVSPIAIDFRMWDFTLTSRNMIKDKTIIHQEGNYLLCKFDSSAE